eukprot:TRINITY_DN802_c0_g1_i5.p1 TRINITY_DN802_c0_g1~~TRINITY_DN802_c0_g1_i5.p1  ORF type:complete len:494 (+),score=154.59 TRINITY_DN802_c0_g1_i5:65-1483(+)
MADTSLGKRSSLGLDEDAHEPKKSKSSVVSPSLSPRSPVRAPSPVHDLNGEQKDDSKTEDKSSPKFEVRVLVSTKDAGAIIGKGGNSIVELQRVGGAKVNISKAMAGLLERVVTMSGGIPELRQTLDIILDKIHPRSSSDTPLTLQLLVANECVSYLKGKRGSPKDIEGETGVRLSVASTLMPESTERNATLHGPRSALLAAFEIACRAVSEYFETGDLETWVKYYPKASSSLPPSTSSSYGSHSHSHSHAYSRSAASPYYGMDPYAAHYAPHPPVTINSSGMHEIQLSVPNASAGAVIGKGGSVISELMRQSGAQIKVLDAVPPATERTVRITGNAQSTEHALQLVQSVLASDPHFQRLQSQAASGMPVHSIQVAIPDAHIGAVFGKRGATIAEIQRQSGTVIKVTDRAPNGGDRILTITGTSSANEFALQLIQANLHADPAYMRAQAQAGADPSMAQYGSSSRGHDAYYR